MERIPVSGPSITQKEIDYVTDAVTHAWFANANLYNERFERAFAAYLGVGHAVALPSCTSAIHLALLALGVGPGDEVVVPDVTWIATAAPVTYVGATPVFADIDPDSWCLAPESLAACLTARTRAVIAVDLYGNLPDVDGVRRVLDPAGIPLVEDAAEAVGSEYRGRRAGSLGEVGVFSFHGSKTLTTGEGGMLVTDRDDLARRVLVLRDHGRAPGDRMFQNREVAYKYKMSSMQAALGLAQLERIDELVARKRAIFGWYRERLEGVEGVRLNGEAPGVLNTYWMVTAVFAPEFGLDKDEMQDLLAAEGVDSRPFFRPLSSLEAYAGLPQARAARARNTVSYAISPYGINLPSGLDMTEEKVERVCRAFLKALHGAAAAGV